MNDRENLPPENEDEALESVEELGGDPDIMESLPNEDELLAEAEDAPEVQPDDLDAGTDGDEFVDGDLPPADDAYLVVADPDIDPDSPLPQGDEAAIVDEFDQPDAGERDPDAPVDRSDAFASLDIDAALAAVASLSDIMAEREAEEERRVAARVDEERPPETRTYPKLPVPPSIKLRRGQPGSVIPALLLIGVGAWLTFALATPEAAPAPLLALGVVIGAFILIMFAQWLASGRWSRGVFFFAAFALLTGGGVAYSLYSGLDLTLVIPLTLFAAGVSFALTGILVRPADRRLFVPGALLVVGGLAGLVVVQGLLPAQLVAALVALWPVVLAAVIIIWLLPVLVRRRS